MPQTHSHNENHHAERSRRSSRSGHSDHKQAGPIASEMAAAADAIRSQICEFRTKGIKAGLQMQTEMLGAIEEIGRDWVARGFTHGTRV